jgi:hypothetical protein
MIWCPQALREVFAMSALPYHPHIVRYHTAWVEPETSGSETEPNVAERAPRLVSSGSSSCSSNSSSRNSWTPSSSKRGNVADSHRNRSSTSGIVCSESDFSGSGCNTSSECSSDGIIRSDSCASEESLSSVGSTISSCCSSSVSSVESCGHQMDVKVSPVFDDTVRFLKKGSQESCNDLKSMNAVTRTFCSLLGADAFGVISESNPIEDAGALDDCGGRGNDGLHSSKECFEAERSGTINIKEGDLLGGGRSRRDMAQQPASPSLLLENVKMSICTSAGGSVVVADGPSGDMLNAGRRNAVVLGRELRQCPVREFLAHRVRPLRRKRPSLPRPLRCFPRLFGYRGTAPGQFESGIGSSPGERAADSGCGEVARRHKNLFIQMEFVGGSAKSGRISTCSMTLRDYLDAAGGVSVAIGSGDEVYRLRLFEQLVKG